MRESLVKDVPKDSVEYFDQFLITVRETFKEDDKKIIIPIFMSLLYDYRFTKVQPLELAYLIKMMADFHLLSFIADYEDDADPEAEGMAHTARRFKATYKQVLDKR